MALIVEQDSSLPIQDGPPCLQTLCKDGIGEGARNNGLFNVGVYLRKAFPDDWENEILQHNMKFIHPPLPLGEVNAVAKQLHRKDYAYKCKDAPINSVCNRELCMTRKFGIEAVVSGVQIANLRKYNSVPPVWFLDVNGTPLELDTEGLLQQTIFQRACVEQLNFMPRSVTKPLWEGRINGLLAEMTENEKALLKSPPMLPFRADSMRTLRSFCTSHQQALEREEILLRRPWTDEVAGITLFRLVDLEMHLTDPRCISPDCNS